ncbi:MAG: TonB-dependent receptor [Terricaulis sp.]
MSGKKKLGWLLLSGASIAAMGAFSPAMAQAQEEEVIDEIVVTATGRSAAIQDVPIAVTAVSGETLQNAGVENLLDITQLAPSLAIGVGQSSATGTIAYIRGIGTGADNPGFESAVGFFIDGVYRARAGIAVSDLPELERIEILRGPQGTLYGRNTSAGAISVVTAGPDFDPGVWIEAGIGDYGYGSMKGGGNLPLGESLSVRVDGSLRTRDGYLNDVTSGRDINNQNRWSARGQALWDISPDASLRVIVDTSETDEECCAVTPIQYGTTQNAINIIVGGAANGEVPGRVGNLNSQLEARNQTVTPGRVYVEQVEDDGISGELNWDIGGVNLTSITAYRDWNALRGQDVDFNRIDIAYREGLTIAFENFTQELRLQGEAGNIDWLVGLFYGDETLDTTDRIRLGVHPSTYANFITFGNTGAAPGGPYQLYAGAPAGAPSIFALVNPLLAASYLTPSLPGQGQQADNWVVDTQSLALFTHNEIRFSDALIMTVGLRYNQETKDLAANLNVVNSSCTSLQGLEVATDPDGSGPLPGAVEGLQGALGGAFSSVLNLACNPAVNPIANGTWAGDSEENEWSGTASLAYHVNEDLMVYGGYSRGYKAGGFNVDRSGFSISPALTDPTLLNTGQLAFDPEFTDAFEAGFKSTILGGSTNFNVTAFYQQIHDYQSNNFNGFNFITRNVPEAISQGVEVELLARPMDNLTVQGGVTYTDAYYDSTVVFNPLDPVPNTISEGQEFSQSPDLAVSGSITYEMPLGDNLQALFYLDGRWVSEYRVQTLNRNPITDNEAFAVINGRIGLGNPNGRWGLELWGRNLTDEFYHVGGFIATLQNTAVVYPNEPATYGITLRARY